MSERPNFINRAAHAAFVAGCAGYAEGFSTCEVPVKSNHDLEFQNSISNNNKKAGVDFEFVRLTVSVTCAGAEGGTSSDLEKAEAWKMPVQRADSPASSARIVGRRYRDELAHNEHDSGKQLRQHGFESSEKPCAASADERTRTHCATKHTPC